MPRKRSRRRRWPRQRSTRILRVGGLVAVAIGAVAWVLTRPEPPPRNPGDLCSIFAEKRAWHRSMRLSSERWKVPAAVQMAVIHQESGFRGNARPPRRKILWIFPGRRLSSAYGYAQAIDATWEQFRRDTGRPDAARYRFDDVAYFVGWYGDQIHRLTGIAKDDAYNLYLAYHEGPAGYRRGTHRGKAWLLQVARRVDSRADRYQSQYDECAARLASSHPWRLWLTLAAVALILWILIRRRRSRRRRSRQRR